MTTINANVANLEDKLFLHLERKDRLMAQLREVELDIKNTQTSMQKHVHALRDPHVVDPEVTP
jgi:hypothetical protein